MDRWPPVEQLRDAVRFALDATAERNRTSLILGSDWTTEVFLNIKVALDGFGLKFQALRNRTLAQSKGFLDAEFIYDFTANIYDEDEESGFLIQTAVAGESEWHVRDNEEWDFHKLLQSDALLCFYILDDYPRNIASRLKRLSEAIVRKQRARRNHSLSTSAYLLSCRWSYPQQYEFWHKFVDPDGEQFIYDEQANQWSSDLRIRWDGEIFVR